MTVTRADGTTEIVPALKPQATQKQRPKRGPLICAMCGDPTTESPTVYSTARGTRGKPVHASCDPSAKSERPKGPPRQRKQNLTPPPARGRVAPGADPATAWIEISCTQCPAQPGQRCMVRYSDGSSAEAKIPHRERALAAKKAAAPR
ncbi:zinc finger domain-containing protein [Streptomyces lavendofoliae]